MFRFVLSEDVYALHLVNANQVFFKNYFLWKLIWIIFRYYSNATNDFASLRCFVSHFQWTYMYHRVMWTFIECYSKVLCQLIFTKIFCNTISLHRLYLLWYSTQCENILNCIFECTTTCGRIYCHLLCCDHLFHQSKKCSGNVCFTCGHVRMFCATFGHKEGQGLMYHDMKLQHITQPRHCTSYVTVQMYTHEHSL